ncbi:unnamed protein product, partial [Cyprideis torosa]
MEGREFQREEAAAAEEEEMALETEGEDDDDDATDDEGDLENEGAELLHGHDKGASMGSSPRKPLPHLPARLSRATLPGRVNHLQQPPTGAAPDSGGLKQPVDFSQATDLGFDSQHQNFPSVGIPRQPSSAFLGAHGAGASTMTGHGASQTRDSLYAWLAKQQEETPAANSRLQ